MTITTRRSILLGSLTTLCLPLLGCGRGAQGSNQTDSDPPDITIQLGALEAASGSRRLGVAVLDGKDGTIVGHRTDERFTMCSTFKFSLAALVLARIDAGEIAGDAMLPITSDDPVGFSPVLREALRTGETRMSVLELTEAAQVRSDNGASNILLRQLGGPSELTAFWRSLGDEVSRLDRYEPQLNESHGDDIRDTTSPAAMARSMNAILAGQALQPASRERLIGWMVETRTGLERLRGGLPPQWRAGDKTGTNPGDGSYDSKTNDIAVVWHPDRTEPFFITGFVETPVLGEPPDSWREQDAVLAQAGRIAAEWITTRI